ncbi:hypothetical protein OAU26_03715 [Mariniblastus sp.]|nr:hypothetical protein [Mariniblastus sp.]
MGEFCLRGVGVALCSENFSSSAHDKLRVETPATKKVAANITKATKLSRLLVIIYGSLRLYNMLIRRHDMTDLEEFALADPHLRICMQAIITRVVSGNPVVTRGGQVVQHEISEWLTNHWSRFARQALRHIFIVGFFAYAVVRRNRVKYPVVLELSSYDVDVDPEFPYNMQLCSAPRSAILASGFGYDPSPSGVFRSLVHTARQLCAYADTMRKNALRTEARRLKPQLFAEITKQAQDVEGVNFDWYVDSNNRFERSAEEVEDLLAKRKMLLGNTEKEGNITVLPRGQHLVPIPAPPQRANLAAALHNAEANIFAVFSVPRHMFMVNSNVKAESATPEYFAQRCLEWGAQTRVFLSDAFHAVYAKEIKQQAKTGTRSADLYTQVMYPQLSIASLSEIQTLYAAQVISWETFSKQSLRKCAMLDMGVLPEPVSNSETPNKKENKEENEDTQKYKKQRTN